MVFNSLHFILFFAVFVGFYFLLPGRYRLAFLFIASCYFYMVYVPVYILVLFFLIITDFILGQKIENAQGRRRKVFLFISIFANLSTLFIFKYFNFFNENIASLARLIHWNYSPFTLRLLLPLGLSFHVFQSLSYVIEVYRQKQKPETNLLVYATYVMFFPQLVAGPIERPQHLLPQLHTEHIFKSQNVTRGLEFMLWGFFKKLVIADRLAVVVDNIYGHLAVGSGPLFVLATLLFAYQLYCDFSGYSDIAVGAALVLGYDLTKNFNRPFASRSVSEFWRRWHISLSNWLRDYVYYSLIFGKKKITALRLYGSLMITMVLIGLWHGANWTFVVMGTVHGAYLCLGAFTSRCRRRLAEALHFNKLPRLYHFWQVLFTFALIAISLIFFRAPSLPDAWYLLSHMTQGWANLFKAVVFHYSLFTAVGRMDSFFAINVFLTAVAIVFMEVVQFYQAKRNTYHLFETAPRLARYLWYYALCLAIIFAGYYVQATAFIYFKF